MAKNGKYNEWSLTLLRVVLGVIFAYHGYLKLFVPGGFKGTVGFFTALGLPAAGYTALLVSVVELFGGLLLILGLLTRWSSIALFIEMLVALFLVHWKNGFLVSSGGYEFVLLLLAGLVVVIAQGPGAFAVASKWKSKNLR